jgi:hypothetical protein
LCKYPLIRPAIELGADSVHESNFVLLSLLVYYDRANRLR